MEIKQIIVIPARMKGTRLPGKPLIKINGMPMIWHVWQNCCKVLDSNNVFVATEDDVSNIRLGLESLINENKNFEDIVKKIKPNEFLKLEPNLRNNDFVVELPDEIKTNFKSLKVVLKDGKEIPNWIKLNPISGEIIANPPENVEKVELKVIIENENGEVTVKDIEINFSDVNPETTEKLLDNDIKFMPLSDQLLKEQTILDNYGSQIINNL